MANANHPFFTPLVEISSAEENLKSAKDALENRDSLGAAALLREAQRKLAVAAYEITLRVKRSG